VIRIMRKYWCTQCLNSSYKSEELLLDHQNSCYKHESVKTKLPSNFKKDKKGNLIEDKKGNLIEDDNYK